MNSSITKPTDLSTEQKIKNAARLIFYQKGFSATKTRDIATEAGINLALLNYYFRSKQKLFDLIMLESLQNFFSSVKFIFDNADSTLDEKIISIVNGYIDLLIEHPDIPIFILSEIRNNPEELMNKVGVKEIVMNSFFMQQFKKGIEMGIYKKIHPLHFFMNLISLTVFPFIAKPILKGVGNLNEKEYLELMQQRKALIPIWIKAMTQI